MFLREKDLREKFWKNYNGKGRALMHQFECPVRNGCIDLLTVEKYQEHYQLNAFEFKLDDIKKVLLQAEENMAYVNRSWIVVPIEKKRIIEDRYLSTCKQKGIGIMYVEEGGRWLLGNRASYRTSITLSQETEDFILGFKIKGY